MKLSSKMWRVKLGTVVHISFHPMVTEAYPLNCTHRQYHLPYLFQKVSWKSYSLWFRINTNKKLTKDLKFHEWKHVIHKPCKPVIPTSCTLAHFIFRSTSYNICSKIFMTSSWCSKLKLEVFDCYHSRWIKWLSVIRVPLLFETWW